VNYQLLKRSLDLDIAINWFPRDSKDDFYPDPINWKDISRSAEDYLEKREHRIFQADTLPHLMEYVPKKSGMLREAIWLHPSHRILYLAILNKFLRRLDSKLCAEIYSYRSDQTDDSSEYPFIAKMDRWKNFYNDFRRAALEESTGAVLLTDLSSYFDHIQINQLGNRLFSILSSSVEKADKEVIQFLLSLLRMWGHDGFGIPHNYDASSFLGSVYLHNVDCEMISNRFRYFRWVDDIRIVAESRDHALCALHDLQRVLAQFQLFPATDKTCILIKGTDKFDELLNVEDDILISQAEDVIARGLKNELEGITDGLFARLEYHSKPNGDERKFRAFANRLLDISDYVEVESEIASRIHDFVKPRFSTYPERSDYWSKMLLAHPSENVTRVLTELLIERPSIFDWQRFHLWRLATGLPTELITNALLTKAKEISQSAISDSVSAQSIVFLGRHADNTVRENLFTRLFTTQRSYIIQRAILIAIQELPTKEYYYRRALEANSDHKELVEFLNQCEQAEYGIKKRSVRHCQEEARPVNHVIKRGIGLSKGNIETFRLSQLDYDY